MFIKLTTDTGKPLLLDTDRIITALEHKEFTTIAYEEPSKKGDYNTVITWGVRETVGEILEQIDEKEGASI